MLITAPSHLIIPDLKSWWARKTTWTSGSRKPLWRHVHSVLVIGLYETVWILLITPQTPIQLNSSYLLVFMSNRLWLLLHLLYNQGHLHDPWLLYYPEWCRNINIKCVCLCVCACMHMYMCVCDLGSLLSSVSLCSSISIVTLKTDQNFIWQSIALCRHMYCK